MVAYRLNGRDIPLVRGGPVRMVVPWAHGFKSIKWLQRVVLTNDYKANDTYALQNNDPESYLKTAAYLGGLAFCLPAFQWFRVADPRMYATWLALAFYIAAYWPLSISVLRSLDRRTRLPGRARRWPLQSCCRAASPSPRRRRCRQKASGCQPRTDCGSRWDPAMTPRRWPSASRSPWGRVRA